MTKHNTTPAASASRHTPEPWNFQNQNSIHGKNGELVLSDMVAPSNFDRCRMKECVNALAGMNPEAVKDVIGLLSEIEQLLVMDAPQPPWIPGGRAKGLPERIRAALDALKGSK